MRSRLVALAVGAVAVLAAAGSSGQPRPPDVPVARIAVSAGGSVSLDGVPIALPALRGRLAELKQRGGVVWYYREGGRGKAPKEAMDVIRLVVEQGLPISLSTRPDYSDVLMPDGTTRRRE